MRPVSLFPPINILDCGVRRVSLGCYRRRGGKLVCERQESRELSPETSDEAAWLTHTEAAIASFGSARGPVVLLLPEVRTLLRMVTLPPGTREQGDAIVRIEAEHNLPFGEDELAWGHVDAGPVGAGRLALLVAARRTLVESLCAAAESAGWEPQAVWPAALAKLAVIGQTEDKLATLQVIVGDGDWLVTRRTVTGGWALRRVIAEQEAARASRELRRTDEYFASLGLGRAEAIGWIGPAPVWMAELEAVLQKPVLIMPENQNAAGAIMRGAARLAGEKMSVVDLSPEARIEARRRGQRGRYVLAALGLFLAAAMTFAVHFHHEAARRIEQVTLQAGELVSLRARAARQQELRTQLAKLREELGQWQGVAARHTLWVRLFADWEDAVSRTDGAWLEKIEIERGADSKEPKRLRVTGCLVERANTDGPDMRTRLEQLLADFGASAVVAAIEPVRYERGPTGRVYFEARVTLGSGGAW